MGRLRELASSSSYTFVYEEFSSPSAPQAGIVIAQEAGGFVTGSRWSPHDGEVTEDILRGRKYLVVRGLAGGKVCTKSMSFPDLALWVARSMRRGRRGRILGVY